MHEDKGLERMKGKFLRIKGIVRKRYSESNKWEVMKRREKCENWKGYDERNAGRQD